MSETKFTPGPWKLDYSDQLEWILTADCYEITSGFADYAPSKVDAQLMAAAPDLYEALEALVKDEHIPEWKRISINMLLAKARGES